MSNIFITLKNIVAHVLYNSKSIENRISIKDCNNYARMIKKIMKIINLLVWLNVKQPYFRELLRLHSRKRCIIDKMLIELYECVVAKICLIICMTVFFVFCNCSHAALSSTLLFLCASVCGSSCILYEFHH